MCRTPWRPTAAGGCGWWRRNRNRTASSASTRTKYFAAADIPSGGSTVRHMIYDPKRRDVSIGLRVPDFVGYARNGRVARNRAVGLRRQPGLSQMEVRREGYVPSP